VFAHIEGAEAHCALGSVDAAPHRTQQARRSAQGIGLVYFRALAEIELGLARLPRGEIQTAIPLSEHAGELGEAADFPGAIILAARGLGAAYNLTGRADEAARVLERGWVPAQAGGFLHYGVICMTHLGEAFSLADRHDRACESVERTLSLAVGSGFRARSASVPQIRAGIRARGYDADARATPEDYEAARSLAHELGMRPHVAHCHLAWAGCTRAWETAREHGRSSLRRCRFTARRRCGYWSEQTESVLLGL
jgi:hypothetical protein